MELKGSLRENILPDIFNLIAQQKISGKLYLSRDSGEEGIIAFADGYIAGAAYNDETIPSKIAHLLTDIFVRSSDEVKGLLISFEGNVRGLMDEIVRLDLVDAEALDELASSITEDLVCAFFLWTKGEYSFTTSTPIADIAPATESTTIVPEAIAMEASRRVDEWARMTEIIKPTSIFVPNRPMDESERPPAGTIPEPTAYLLYRLDGITPVKHLYRSSFLTEYKTYEALNTLLQDDQITVLSDTISISIAAALEHTVHEKKQSEHREKRWVFGALWILAITAIITIGIALRRHTLTDDATQANEQAFFNASRKFEIAQIELRIESGMQNPTLEAVVDSGMMLKSDAVPLIQKER